MPRVVVLAGINGAGKTTGSCDEQNEDHPDTWAAFVRSAMPE